MNKLAVIQRGSLAEVAYGAFSEVVKKRQRDLLALLVGNSRNQEYSHEKLIAFAASYSALEDILEELRRQIRNGNQSQKEVIENDGP